MRVFLKDSALINGEIPTQAYHHHNKYIRNIYDRFMCHLSYSKNDGLGDLSKDLQVLKFSDIIQY